MSPRMISAAAGEIRFAPMGSRKRASRRFFGLGFEGHEGKVDLWGGAWVPELAHQVVEVVLAGCIEGGFQRLAWPLDRIIGDDGAGLALLRFPRPLLAGQVSQRLSKPCGRQTDKQEPQTKNRYVFHHQPSRGSKIREFVQAFARLSHRFSLCGYPRFSVSGGRNHPKCSLGSDELDGERKDGCSNGALSSKPANQHHHAQHQFYGVKTGKRRVEPPKAAHLGRSRVTGNEIDAASELDKPRRHNEV